VLKGEEKMRQKQWTYKSEPWLWVSFFCGLILVLAWFAYATFISSLAATNTREQIIFIVEFSSYVIAATFVYLTPSFLGLNKRNAAMIAVLNLYLGWTVIGWLAAFVWANLRDRPQWKN
jgi:Superinfection immunity protein